MDEKAKGWLIVKKHNPRDELSRSFDLVEVDHPPWQWRETFDTKFVGHARDRPLSSVRSDLENDARNQRCSRDAYYIVLIYAWR